MGYTHDTGMVEIIFPSQMVFSGGTWADAASSHVWTKDKTAGANTSLVRVPLDLPHNRAGLKGACLVGVDVWWSVTTADLNALTAEIYKASLPLNGQAMTAPASLGFAYDAAHAQAADRISQDKHAMSLTLTSPTWLGAGDDVYVELSINAAAGSLVKIYAARARYTLRV